MTDDAVEPRQCRHDTYLFVSDHDYCPYDLCVILLMQPSGPQAFIANAIITGGTFSQVNHNHGPAPSKSGFDLLQEAVAPAAFHNSGERFDPPKCHPQTRTAVLQKIIDWVLGSDPHTRDSMIMWLSGAAGAGKSAIAQSLAEHCSSQGRLLASFFFGRSDPTRNHAGSLVATIAYQLYTLLPAIRPSLSAAVEDDPFVFKRSLGTQFQYLLVTPVQQLLKIGFFEQSEAPRLIILDGLDECLDRAMQRKVLEVFSQGIRDAHLPFILLVASRPEHDIKATFNSKVMADLLTNLILDETYLPDQDIELFLRDSFSDCKENHPFKQFIPTTWPSDKVIRQLVQKSSGQFIYAATVVKYITSSRHRPHHRLEVVLAIRPAARDLPFSELDALYTHIFSLVEAIEQVLRVISFDLIFRNLASIDSIEKVLGLEPGDIVELFCDLASVIDFRPHGWRKDSIYMHYMHASLSDFLLDSRRSKTLHIDTTKQSTALAGDCFRFLAETDVSISNEQDLETAIFFFEYNTHLILLDDDLAKQAQKISIPEIFGRAFTAIRERGEDVMAGHLQQFIYRFLPAFFSMLKDSNFEDSQTLYSAQIRGFDHSVMSALAEYGGDLCIQLKLAIIGLSVKPKILPVGALNSCMQLHPDPSVVSMDVATLQLTGIRTGDYGYINLLADFLGDRRRSKQYALGPELFTNAAICCLKYLCDHHSFQQKADPRHTQHDKDKRRNKPWFWHRRFPRGDRVGKNTPWMWLRKPRKFTSIDPNRILHRKRGDLVYLHSRHVDISMQSDQNDPVVFFRVLSEKYWLFLHYLLYFLPRANRSNELTDLCQRCVFASRSQDFPRKSRKARQAMADYLQRFGDGMTF